MSQTNEQKMFEAIVRWQQSGLSQKPWCAQNGIAYSSFHYWYKRFRNQQAESKPVSGKERFVELLVPNPPSATPWCALVLGDGKQIVFHQPVSAKFLRSLMD
ncbi:MAG: hypothetical protein EOO15_20695 [Chitinophagaceae bacterium]|nr:MAG: hypothetical protein EOO15_20695 [Chitinophagaceae bacterium]